MISLDSYETKGAPLTASCFTTTNSSFPLTRLGEDIISTLTFGVFRKHPLRRRGKGAFLFFHCYVRDLLKLSHSSSKNLSQFCRKHDRLTNFHISGFLACDLEIKSNCSENSIWVNFWHPKKNVCHSGRKNDKFFLTKGWFFMVMNSMVEYVKNDMKQTKAGVMKYDTNPKQCPIFCWEIPQN